MWPVPPQRAACLPPRFLVWHWGNGPGDNTVQRDLDAPGHKSCHGLVFLGGSEEGLSSSMGLHHHGQGHVSPLGTVTCLLWAGDPQSVGNWGPGRGEVPKHSPC